MSYPEIPPASRPDWVKYLKVFTIWGQHTIYGNDAVRCKTWQVSDTIIRFGFEDAEDWDYNDFMIDVEELAPSYWKLTLVSADSYSNASVYWNEQLITSDFKGHIGQSYNVSIAIVKDIYDDFVLTNGIDEPSSAGGYWIVGYWVRKVRAVKDKTLADDHNIPRAVLIKIKDVEAQKA